MRLTNDLKDLYNARAQGNMTLLEVKINTKINEILLLKDEYVEIDDIFDSEIEANCKRKIRGCGCLKV